MKKKSIGFQLLSPRTSVVLFSVLVVATPFLMLQNYLQSTFRKFGGTSVNIFGLECPIILLIVLPIVIGLITYNYKKATKIRAISLVFILIMMYLGQSVSDFYINYKFYDLQNNWHYFAYCFFTIIMYRYLITKDNISLSRIIIITFLRGAAISVFDEGVQVFISNRIFDLSDVAKDLWGLWIGNIAIFFLFENGKIIKEEYKILNKKLKDYFYSPKSLIFFQGVFTFIFLFFSAVLTDSRLAFYLLFITLAICTIVFLSFHLAQYKKIKYIIATFYIAILLGLSISYAVNRNNGLMSIGNNFVIYKGIPIPYFDVFIKPDGFFRLVDKKEHIKKGDMLTINEYEPNILIFALNDEDYQGNKLINIDNMKNIYFTYNPINRKGIQILVLDYVSAKTEYNYLISQNKKAAIIIHNN